jgi:hypothetical protein
MKLNAADWSGRGNGPAGVGVGSFGGLRSPPKAKVKRSNRVGCAKKEGAGGAGAVAGIQRRKGISLPLSVARRVSPAPNRSGEPVRPSRNRSERFTCMRAAKSLDRHRF